MRRVQGKLSERNMLLPVKGMSCEKLNRPRKAMSEESCLRGGAEEGNLHKSQPFGKPCPGCQEVFCCGKAA